MALRSLPIITAGCLAACTATSPRARVLSNTGPQPPSEPAPSAPTYTSRAAIHIARLEEPATTTWDVEVQQTMLAAFDRDGSGQIDRTTEVRAIPCDVWRALDDAVRASNYAVGFAIVYGLPADKGWVGDVVGFGEALRPVFADQAARCGLDIGGDPSLTGYDPSFDYDAGTAGP